MAMPRLLLVEDDVPLAGMLRTHLERDGYEVVQAADGATALNEVRRHPPDVVVLDIGLPGLDGFETARLIRGREEFRRTPIIFLSASESDRFPANSRFGFFALIVDGRSTSKKRSFGLIA